MSEQTTPQEEPQPEPQQEEAPDGNGEAEPADE